MKASDYFLPHPKAVAVECRPDYQLAVEFDNGEHGVFDMKPFLDKGVFRALQDEKLFRSVRVAYGTVAWYGRQCNLDLDPAVIYHESVKSSAGEGRNARCARGPISRPNPQPGSPDSEALSMPTISMFYGIAIRMFFGSREHPPPHFHAQYAEHEACIEIETGKVLSGSLPRRQLRLVQAWTELHREDLLVNWKLAMNGEAPLPIAPLL